MISFIKEPTHDTNVVITDVDKTLATGERAEAYMKAGSQKEDEVLAKRFNINIDAVVSQIREAKESISQEKGRAASKSEAVMAMGVTFQEWNILRESCYEPEKFLREDPNLILALQNVLPYIRVVAATNAPRKIGERTLRVLGFEKLVKEVTLIAPEDAGHCKPQKKYFRQVFNSCNGVLPKNMLALGDRADNDLWPPVQLGVGGAVQIQKVQEVISILLGLADQKERQCEDQLLSIPQLAIDSYYKGQVRIVCVVGQAGGGKTTFCQRLEDAAFRLGILTSILSLDAFFKLSSKDRREWLAEGQQISPEEAAIRRDQMNWWDFDKAREVLQTLKEGKEVHLTGIYNRKDKGELTGELHLPASDEKGRLILLEGVGAAHLHQYVDRMVFLYVPPAIRFERILSRDADRRPRYDEALQRFRLTEEFERGYFPEYWGYINMILNNSALMPSMEIGLSAVEALELDMPVLHGIKKRPLSQQE